MSATVTVHRLVERDLRIAASHYEAEGGSRLSERFLADAEATIQRLGESPRQFHFQAPGLRRAPLGTFPYHFLYEEEADTVRILVLRHDRRHPRFGIARQ